MRSPTGSVRLLAGVLFLGAVFAGCGGAHATVSIPPVTASSDVVLDT